MELKVNVKDFVNAVNWATKNYDTKDDYSYVALTIDEDGNGTLSHTNTTSYMKSDYPVVDVNFDGDDVSETALALDGNFLRKFSKAIANTGGELVLSKKLSSKKAVLEAKTASGKFTLPLFDAKIKKAPAIVELGEVNDNEFFDMLNRVAKLCDTNTSGSSMFTGAVDFGFDAAENTVSLFATDRFALSEVVLEFTASQDDEVSDLLSKHILLPYDKAGVVGATKGVDTVVSLVAEEGTRGVMRVGYSFPDGRVALFSLLDATPFPGVEDMKKKAVGAVEHSVVVEKADLVNAINVVSSLAWEEDHIYLTVSEDGLVVSDAQDANSLAVASADVSYDGAEPYRAKFLRTILNESFHPLTTSSVALKWGSNSAAFVFESLTEDGEAVENVFVMAVLAKQ